VQQLIVHRQPSQRIGDVRLASPSQIWRTRLFYTRPESHALDSPFVAGIFALSAGIAKRKRYSGGEISFPIVLGRADRAALGPGSWGRV
jgi:hypothetical protein